jgi:two-component system OmpR family response regulator
MMMSVETWVSPGAGPMAASNENGPSVRVLIVDHDPTVMDTTITYLDGHGIRGIAVPEPQKIFRELAESEPDLVILNLHQGQFDGLDLLRSIRSRSDIPIIITTCDRRDDIDRIIGLELGADDCLTKPFGLRELLARIRSVLRRRQPGRATSERDAPRGKYRFGGWLLDRRIRRLTNPAGAPVTLTKGEYALLNAFLDAPQRPLSREHLQHATRIHEDVFDRTIDVQVLRLRRKLETDASVPRVILTERGIGYVFALAVEVL